MGEILSERVGGVLVVTIANEAKRNCVSAAMEQPLYDALVGAEADEAIRVVVITGAGDVAFCSGHDMKEVGQPGIKNMWPDPMGHPSLMRKPVIAAVNGHCHAAGLMMALCCDLRVASENAVFGQPGAKIGQLPAGGQIWRLAEALPRARAMEMMLTADFLTAQEAFEGGMVNRLVAQGQALSTALELAERIARNSPAVVQAIKAGLKVYDTEGRQAFEAYEGKTVQLLMQSQERIEASKAFAEKRQTTS